MKFSALWNHLVVITILVIKGNAIFTCSYVKDAICGNRLSELGKRSIMYYESLILNKCKEPSQCEALGQLIDDDPTVILSIFM